MIIWTIFLEISHILCCTSRMNNGFRLLLRVYSSLFNGWEFEDEIDVVVLLDREEVGNDKRFLVF